MTMAVENAPQENDGTSVSVAVRIRPQSVKEKLSMNQICTTVAPNAPQIILGKDSSFTFDYVFSTNSTQEQIFEALAKPLIDGCMDGYNATILAYGQTGSGKTYTMGTAFELGIGHNDAGIVPRAVQYLFASVAHRRAQAAARHEPVPEFKVVAQFLELYNEELVDLLDGDRARKPHLRLHENAQGDIYLTGVSTRLVSSLDDTLKCLRDGSLVRSTASTNMNAQSSRSHAIFTLHIRQQRLVKYDEESNGPKPQDASQTDQDPDSTGVDQVPEFETLTAKFHFVDLAGSERLKRTGATGDRAKEGISINRGLLALGNVISALGDKAKRGCHVPYRDSKLTRLLQDSLGGNSRTIMIACISPSDCDFVETLNTLKYANRARNIRNRVIMNQDKTSKQLATLRAQLAALQEELDEYKQGKRIAALEGGGDGVSDLARELACWRAENDKLHLRIKALTVTVDTLKVRNAQLLADQEASSWALSKARLLQAAQGNHLDSNAEDGIQLLEKASSQSSPLHVIVEEMDSFRQLVEKYTVENEELRTKLVEAEALSEFWQRTSTQASPGHPNRLSDGVYGSRGGVGASHRVALTANEFPDLDSSTIAAAEAGLSAADFYLDGGETTTTSSLLTHKSRRHRRHQKKKRQKQIQDEADESQRCKPLEEFTANQKGADTDTDWDGKSDQAKERQDANKDRVASGDTDEAGDSMAFELNGDTYTDLDEEGADEELYNPMTDSTCMISMENTDDTDDVNDTLLADNPGNETLTHSAKPKKPRPASNDHTLSDASDVESSGSDQSGGDGGDSSDDDEAEEEAEDRNDAEEDDAEASRQARGVREAEAKLHRSLAHISSAIDSKQRLLAELQAKAAQLDQLRRHYERQLTNLQTRIRETERERDSVLANLGQLEHTGEERLRRTREEFEKKLNSLQDEVKQLQMSRQEQVRLEREQAKKNNELRQLRAELEDLRRYKVDLTRRLQQETKRSREIEAMSVKRMMELKKAKSQADNHIRTLTAAHTAKERALKQKQAELEALKRKTLEQQRQLSMSASRMTRSVYSVSTPSTVAPKSSTRNAMSSSMYGGASQAPTSSTNAPSRLMNAAKAKWNMVLRQLETEIQRRETSARLEHDLQTWVRERESLGRRLLRLQRRRARVEESTADDTEQDDLAPKLAQFDEQIRNITAQLESVQEAIRECQFSIIELDKSGPRIPGTLPSRGQSRTARAMSNPTLALFSNCTLTESRFLLGQLYEAAVSRGLHVSRLQQSEAQLRANLSVWEQEREQELEVLRLAMQHAGLPMDSVDNLLSVASSTGCRATRPVSATSCPQHGSISQSGCEWCSSANGGPASAPLSSDESSGDESRTDDHSTDRSVSRRTAGSMMSHSMYATLEPTVTTRCVRRHLSEADDSSVDRQYDRFSEAGSRTVKARGRMLQPHDMLGLSTPVNTGQYANDFSSSDLMPPPSGNYFLRRPRTAFGNPTMNGLGGTAVVPSTPRTTNAPLSAGPSPAVRRRIPGYPVPNAPTPSTTRSGLTSVHSVPAAMSTSLTLPSSSGETTDLNSSMSTGQTTDVFNRLTSGMFSSPHPSRGSIQPLQRTTVTIAPPFLASTTSSVTSGSTQSYRLASSTGVTTSSTFTVSINQPIPSNSGQPLAAFFANSSATPSTVTQSTATSSSSAAPAPVASYPVSTGMANQPVPSFRVPMECTHVARGHSNAVLDVDVVGSLMVTGSKDRTAKVWDLETMEEVDTLRDHPNNVSKVRMCPVTGLIFTVCSYFIKVWDRRDPRKCIRTLLSSGLYQDGELETKITRRQNICPPGETNIMDIVLGGPHPALAHSMFLATANSVKLWDLRRYYAVGKLHGSHQAPVMVLAAGQTPSLQTPDSQPQLTVVTGSKDHYIKVFNVGADASGLLTPTFDLEPPHYDGIESLVLHGSTLFSGSRDATIKKWNLARDGRQEVMLAQAHKDWIQGLAITSDGQNLISGCRAGHLKVWNVEDCMCLGELPNAHDGAVNVVRAYGDRIFTAGNDKDVRFWRLLDPLHN